MNDQMLELNYARDRLLIKIAQGLEILLTRAGALQTSTQVEAAESLFESRLDKLYPAGPELEVIP